MIPHSKITQEDPQEYEVTCDECGELFMEIFAVIQQNLQMAEPAKLLCINCDPAAEERLSLVWFKLSQQSASLVLLV